MLLPLLVYLFVNVIEIISHESTNEPSKLADLFIESLKNDPFLLGGQDISKESEKFIDVKIEKFVQLVSRSQTAKLSRAKRSLNNGDLGNENKYSISIFPELTVPTHYAEDLRLLQTKNGWFAVSLEDRSELLVYHYENESFHKVAQEHIQYATNVAALNWEGFSLIVVGEYDHVKVFQFDFKKGKLENFETVSIENPRHIALWVQDDFAYLSITSTSVSGKSLIQIYQWLGSHFDQIQDIPLFNVKKTVPFSIQASHFLAAVKYNRQEGEIKSYSEVFKFDMHSMRFRPYQRLSTNGCTDIKYFTALLHGEEHYFLVVVHSVNDNSSKANNSLSVIYKFEDQYLIPFQSLKTNAVEWQPIKDGNGKAALIAVTTDGLKGFQYDGWHFIESDIIHEDPVNLRYNDLRTVHTYDFNGKRILATVCDHCKSSTIYSLNFTDSNSIKKLHSQILSWCTENLKQLEGDNVLYEVVGESLRGDLHEQISDEEDELSIALSKSSNALHNIEDQVLPSDEVIIFQHNLKAETIIFNNTATPNSLNTALINNINISGLLDNVLNIQEGFSLSDSMEFGVVIIENDLEPAKLNNVSLEEYILLNKNLIIDNFTVNGSITFKSGLNIENSANNISINEQSLLIKDVDQVFAYNLSVEEIETANLRTKQLNGLDISSLNTTINHPHQTSYIKHLKVRDLQIGGLLNRISVPVLERRALKKRGDQIIEAPISFDSLTVDAINVGGNISGRHVPGDFVFIHSGEYVVDQDVEFLNVLQVNNLEVMHSLNNISVNNDGGLDILLTDSPYTQYVPAKKTFENLIVTNPIKLRNKINNEQMQRYNPVLIDSDTYELEGDVTINGLATFARWVKADDLKPQYGNKSLGHILEMGIKLSDTEIPMHLTFSGPLDLEDIVADKVNLRNPHDWLLESSNSSQIVKGPKRFVGDLYLEGQVNAFRINEVDVHDLEKNALRVKGDQVVDGVLVIDRIVAKAGIKSNHTQFKESNRTSNDDILIINGDLELRNLTTSYLRIKGLLNAQNISEIVRNIVRKDAPYKVFGKKTFKELHVQNLVIPGENSDFLRLLQDVDGDQIALNGNISLYNNVSVHELNFGNNINNMSKEYFGDMMMSLDSATKPTVITSEMEYNEIVVLGDVFVADNFIGDINITSLQEDTVKTDEDHEFRNARFDKAILVNKTLYLDGNIENLDLTNIVKQNSEGVISIDVTTFSSTVFIDGTLYVNNTVNGIDLHKFCSFSHPTEKLKTLKIEGDVMFAKGPNILNFNDLNVKDLKETLWLTDKAANISGTVNMKNVTFNNSVHVLEFIDATNLSLLSKNYLSKSKRQEILASFRFDDVTFSNISTPLLKIRGPINGAVINDILKTMLLQGVPQVFENTAYYEELLVHNLNDDADYTVNGLNLRTDVMRYDQENVVTGHKIFRNLNIDVLNLTHNIMIQNVDILDWLGNAVLIDGTFRIKEKKILNGGTFKQGLSLRGKLNDQIFNEETVMLVNAAQDVTGKKIFVPVNNKPTKFKILHSKGLVNGIDIRHLVQNQTNRLQNTTLSSKIIFDNNVTVKNINVDVIYDNVNVSELIANVSRLGNLNKFQNKFNNLLAMGMEVENTVKDQTTFFKYYKEILELEGLYDVFGVRCKDDVFRIVTLSVENGSNIFKTFEWNSDEKMFSFSGKYVESKLKPNYLEQISLGEHDYLYIESCLDDYEIQSYKPGYSGRLLQLLNSNTFETVAEFHKNATESLVSFTNPSLNQHCLGFIGTTLSGINIFCDESDQHAYYWTQRIPMNGVYKAAAVHTQGSVVYLFLARRGLPFQGPSVVVLQSGVESSNFKEIQTIFEGADVNGLAAASIEGVPYLTLSFGSQEASVESGWISVRRLDSLTNQFLHWQHIEVTAPLGVHFVTQTSFEPLLLVPSEDASAPLQTLRYDGISGFKRILRGSSLPANSKVRVIGNGHFLGVLQEERNVATILAAVVKRSMGN